MAADDPLTQGARASAAMHVIQSSQNILSFPEELIFYLLS